MVIMIQSIVEAYQDGDNRMDGEYMEDARNTPGSSDDIKPKTEDDVLKKAVGAYHSERIEMQTQLPPTKF